MESQENYMEYFDIDKEFVSTPSILIFLDDDDDIEIQMGTHY